MLFKETWKIECEHLTVLIVIIIIIIIIIGDDYVHYDSVVTIV
jgi:hypothetical protein